MFAVGVVCKHLSVQCMFFMTPATLMETFSNSAMLTCFHNVFLLCLLNKALIFYQLFVAWIVWLTLLTLD